MIFGHTPSYSSDFSGLVKYSQCSRFGLRFWQHEKQKGLRNRRVHTTWKDVPKGLPKRTSQRETQAHFTSYFTRLYSFFLKNVQVAYQYFGCLGCSPRKRRPGFDQKKMTQHSLAENCCSWIWEPNDFPRYPAMGCREDSSLISKLPSGYLILKRLPLWQKGYQLGFFRSIFAT